MNLPHIHGFTKKSCVIKTTRCVQLRDILQATSTTFARCLLILVSLLGSTLKMEVIFLSKHPLIFPKTTPRYIPEDTTLQEQEEKGGGMMEAKASRSVRCACLRNVFIL
jgi:hypothetical protein